MMGVLTSGFSSTLVGQTEARSLDYAIHKMIEKYAHVCFKISMITEYFIKKDIATLPLGMPLVFIS